jgi:hypothetical protein
MASSAHFYINWAKERLDEMDAVLASLEGKAAQVAADSRIAADKMIADLRGRRDVFSSEMKKQSEAGEATWQQTKVKLESEWNDFQRNFKTYVERFGEQLKQQKATFEGVAAAQAKAWRESTQKLQSFSEEMAAGRRAQIDTAIQQMKAEASAAEANLQKLANAGSESWSALSAGLAESRAAFDRANQTAWDAFKRATSAGQ